MTCINTVDFRSPPERKNKRVKLTILLRWRFNKLVFNVQVAFLMILHLYTTPG